MQMKELIVVVTDETSEELRRAMLVDDIEAFLAGSEERQERLQDREVLVRFVDFLLDKEA